MTALQGTEHERETTAVSYVSNQLTYTTVFGSAISSDVLVGEFGIFNAASGGTLLCRFIVDEFTMLATDIITVEWALQVGE